MSMYEALLDRFTQLCKDVFDRALTGVYLHGSMAMGCFQPQKSDIDLIVVVETALTDAQKRIFLREVVALNREAPPKGLELSVVQRRFCSPFVYPTPYEFHFSPAYLALAENPAAYIQKLQGNDP
ncbi:MAG: nucleotidyltransferase domain-containing protein, partial [Kiritimatiellae bacterium]|nr:nucleotidyltransferase domain-containing protein [Kiritimatiellia bacterium]